MKTALLSVAAVAALVMGCGNSHDNAGKPSGAATGPTSSAGGSTSTPPPPQSSAPSGGSSTGAASSRCRTADLSGELRSDGAAAGNMYATLILTNVTNHECTIDGYGGLQLVDEHHKAIATKQERDTNHPPKPVALKPRGNASAVLHWGDVPSGNEPVDRPCEPTASFLNVIPPDETTALSIKWDAGPVCQQGRIEQWAYQQGIVSP